MLLQLHIENIAVIESVDLAFQDGFHVLSGETGAGKSMIIDAINMILGERVSKDIIRSGSDKAYVEALFETDDPYVSAALEDAGIPFEDELLISKELNSAGKSVCRINGRMVTAALLRVVGSRLVNLHGQFDNQMLFQPRYHTRFLDRFGEIDLTEYQQEFDRNAIISKELRKLDLSDEATRERFERLRFQVAEIEEANLSIDEEEEIRKDLQTMEHAEQISKAIGEACSLLYNGDAGHTIYDIVSRAVRTLSSIERFDEGIAPLCERLQNLVPETEELAVDLRSYGESVTFDQYRITELHERLNLIQQLKRKYGGDIETVLESLAEMKTELERLEYAEENYEALQLQLEESNRKLSHLAEVITEKRRLVAEKLEREITDQLYDLDMNGAIFCVNLISQDPLSRNGAETVEFLISTMPGSESRPLTKIASGGEMSRVMLAIQVVLNELDTVQTLIFDEIDTGVSGRAAQKIAQKLYRVACNKQVLCITHLSQLAVMADVHYLIEKTSGESAKTSVIQLDKEGRISELSRIMNGADFTDLARQNAEEMLMLAEAHKKELRI